MKLIKLINSFEINYQIQRNSVGTVLRMPVITRFGKVEQAVNTESLLFRESTFTFNTMDGKFQRIWLRCSIKFSPIGNTVLVDCTYFERIRSFGFQPFKQQVSVADSRIKHPVKLYFIEVGISYFIPCRLQCVSFSVFLRYLCILRDS